MSAPERNRIDPPEETSRVLLHSCCAPCSGEVIETMVESGVQPTVFFYNPNVHPRREYDLRKASDQKFCEKLGVPHVDGDYDTKNWFERTRGLEWEPERGARCTACFDLRFEVTAAYAAAHGFSLFTSCLGISRWKDFDQVTASGRRAAARFPGLSYWDYNWRKSGGAQRMLEVSKRERFYQQEYCGCVYSRRDTDAWRVSRGKNPIKIGEKFYGQEPFPNR